MTTPNVEYNVRWETLPAGHSRHGDHRFEWTREEFRAWAHQVAGRHGYEVEFTPVGPDDPEVGPPTQMAVFTSPPPPPPRPPRRRRRPHDRQRHHPGAHPARHRPLLVVLIGASGSGKSTFARRHFKPTEVISSDFCRGLVADDENDQSASGDAFDVLHYIAGKRLAAGRRTVVDATNVQQESRRQLIEIAKKHDVLPIAIVLDVPEEVCAERNASRTDRADMPRRVIQRHIRELRRSLRHLEREGFRKVHVLRGVAEIESAEVRTEKRFNDLTHLTGPFDIIGDIHGCASSWRPCSASSVTSTARTLRAVRPSSSATSSTAARTRPEFCAA